ncbi:MAG: hypothetical protein EOP45_21410, partial [Sphingobacteriaceae bacterium]
MKKLLLIVCSLLTHVAIAQDVSLALQKKPDISPLQVTSQWSKVGKNTTVSFATSSKRFAQELPPDIKENDMWTASAWKGEKVHTQILLWSKANLANVTVNLSDLKNAKGDLIKKEQISTGFLEYVMTDEFRNGCGYRKPQDFDRSLREKCRACALLMCALIMSRVRDQRSSNEGHHEVTCDDDYIWLADQHKIKSDMGENWLTIFNLGPTPNVKHTKRSNLWNHWMKTCSESHGICSTAAERTGEWLAPQDASSTQLDTPDRLVEFSTTDAEATFAWRIVHGKDLVHTK